MRAPARLALLALWCGLATGLAELALRFVQKFALQRYIYLSRQIVWMTPAADVLLFGACLLVLGGCAAAWPRAASMRVSATVCAFVAAMSVLALQPWMAIWAMLILAAGFAVQAGRLAAAHEATVMRLLRRTAPVLAAMVAALALWVNGRSLLAQRRAEAALPAAPSGAPNVLLVVWDAVRAANLSLYGYSRPTTPHLDTLAARGTTFERAFSTGPYTMPGHASLFTGRWPHQLRASWLPPLDADVPTLAGTLGRNGWRTGAFSANHLFVTWEHGLMRGFAHSQDYVLSPGQFARSSALLKWLLAFDRLRGFLGWYDVPGRRYAPDIRASFLQWLDRDRSRPFFAFLNVYDAHEPYLPPAPFDTLFSSGIRAGAAERRAVRAKAIADPYTLGPPDIAWLQDQYDGGIAAMDADLAVLTAELRQRGVLDNTLIIVTGDHGEEFGEHRMFGHGSSLYLPAVHVPLAMILPGTIPAGSRVALPASLRDVPATVLELLRIPGEPPLLPGRSLTRLWRTGVTAEAETILTEVDRLPRGEPDWIPVLHGHLRSIVAWPWQLIVTGAGLELYDLAADAAQRRNLADAPEHRARRDALVAALGRWRRDAVPGKRQ